MTPTMPRPDRKRPRREAHGAGMVPRTNLLGLESDTGETMPRGWKEHRMRWIATPETHVLFLELKARILRLRAEQAERDLALARVTCLAY